MRTQYCRVLYLFLIMMHVHTTIYDPMEFDQKLEWLTQSHLDFLSEKNQRLEEDYNGIFYRYRFSVLTSKLTATNYGRDHHPRSFSIWMAGGGVKAGMVYGETDDFGYNVVKDPVYVHDFQATMMHLLGIDHERLIYKYQGKRFRLTDVSRHVIKELNA